MTMSAMNKEVVIRVKEAETMRYTFLNEILKHNYYADRISQGGLQQTLSALQVSDILSSCAGLQLNIDEEILELISFSMQHGYINETIQSYTTCDIACIMWSIRRLNMIDQTGMIAALFQKSFIS